MGVQILGGNEVVTGDVAVITTDHKYIHQGQAFIVSLVSDELTKNGGTEKIRFKTPAVGDGYVHWRPISASSTKDLAKVELYEGATITDEGTELTPNNRNRPMAERVSNSVIGQGATTSDDGLLLATFSVGSGGRRSQGGSVQGDADEIVFKADTEYVIILTNIGTTSNSHIYIGLTWYEEPSYGEMH